MKRALPLLALLLLPSGCIDLLDDSWFNPDPVDEYEFLHNEVPWDYIELVSMEGTAVEGDDAAPTIAGIWVHQCLADQPACFQAQYPEFESRRQDQTILYLHGNGGNLGRYWDRIQMLWRMGFRVFAVDYRGYGLSSGVPSEAGIYADARTGLVHVLGRMVEEEPDLAGPDGQLPNPLFVDLAYYGWSLGSAAAIDLSVERPSKALIIEAAMASGQAFVDDAAGLGIDSSVLMDAGFDNVSKIPFVPSPKLISHGLEDDFVKFEFSQALYDAAEEPKQLYPVTGAGHGNVPCPTRPADQSLEEGPCLASEDWLATVGSFLGEHMP